MSSRSRLYVAQVVLLLAAEHALAASLPSTPLRRGEASTGVSSTTIYFTNAASPYNFMVYDLQGASEIIYTANVTVDGVPYVVRIL